MVRSFVTDGQPLALGNNGGVVVGQRSRAIIEKENIGGLDATDRLSVEEI